MSKHMDLYENLLKASRELEEIFGVNSVVKEMRRSIDRIREHNNETFEVVRIPGPRALIWTKEGGKRKLILWSQDRGDRTRLNQWREMTYAKRLKRRGIRISLAPYAADPDEIRLGADEDILELEPPVQTKTWRLFHYLIACSARFLHQQKL